MPEVFKIGFSEGAFVVAVAGELATPGVTALAAASRFFGASLLNNLRKAMGSRLIKDPAVRASAACLKAFARRAHPLEALASG